MENVIRGEETAKEEWVERGFTGNNGGSTGSLNLKVKKSLGLFVSISQEVGQGSFGGEGGVGGVGQNGGYHDVFSPPANINCGQICVKNPIQVNRVSRIRERAQAGAQGPQGGRGALGANGTLRDSTVVVEGIKDEEINYLYYKKFDFFQA